jgi:hypothetical protein
MNFKVFNLKKDEKWEKISNDFSNFSSEIYGERDVEKKSQWMKFAQSMAHFLYSKAYFRKISSKDLEQIFIDNSLEKVCDFYVLQVPMPIFTYSDVGLEYLAREITEADQKKVKMVLESFDKLEISQELYQIMDEFYL